MKVSFKPYCDLKIATQTWVVYTNLEIDNYKLFQAVQCVPIHAPVKSATNRMKVDVNENLNDGDIVFVEYNKQTKGMPFKPITNREMRNCSTIIMKMNDRYHNIKISRGGSFQMTGVKNESYVRKIVAKMWIILKDCPNAWVFQSGHEQFLGFMVCCMHNVTFNLYPYKIDLEKLNYTVKMEVSKTHFAEYTSTYEPSVGYVGANVKISAEIEPIHQSRVVKVTELDNTFQFEYTTFDNYLNHLPRKTKSKKVTSSYQHSFMVFSTGHVIMSGKMSETNREESYKKFCEMIEQYGHAFLRNEK